MAEPDLGPISLTPSLSRREKGKDQGQVLPIALVMVIALAFFVLLGLNIGFLAERRVRIQNAADASAYTAGVCYARGLNAIATTNDLLIGAAVVDVITLIVAPEAEGTGASGAKTPPPVLYRMTVKMQNWFVEFWRVVTVEEPVRIGLANDVLAIQLWDDQPTQNIVPRFNVKRTFLMGKIFEALAGRYQSPDQKKGEASEELRKQVWDRNGGDVEQDIRHMLGTAGGSKHDTSIETHERDTYDFLDKKTGKRVQVNPDDVETVEFQRRSGKTERRYRIKSQKGEKGGYWVRRNAAPPNILDLPLPLIEEDGNHVVMTCALSKLGKLPFDPAAFENVPAVSSDKLKTALREKSGLPPLEAFAETEVTGGSLSYWASAPSWRPRFCRVHLPEEASYLEEGDLRVDLKKESGLNERILH